MAHFLEAAMLVCFGFSWPMNVYKNYKAGTAKSMSIQFILLIITGYVAGITAKLWSHTINYVLAVYIINLAIVSVNVFVYIRNRRLDRLAEGDVVKAEGSEAANTEEIDDKLLCDIKKYENMNMNAQTGGVVFFGSDSFDGVAFSELAQSSEIDVPVYNRSFSGLHIGAAVSAADQTVADLAPSKIFINLGEVDISDENFSQDKFIESYRGLLSALHEVSDAAIYVVSIISDSPVAVKVNARLKKLARECECEFADISSVAADEKSRADVDVFNRLRVLLRSHPISFGEAMAI